MSRVNKCIVCQKTSLNRVIELGFHPLADTFLQEKQLLHPLKTYPLNCLLCTNCGHVQNEYVVSGEERYIESNYSYNSANSAVARLHWQEFLDSVSSYTKIATSDHVIEFGSNDGQLLKMFKEKGAIVTGIEPSPIMAGEAKKIGMEIIEGFLNQKTISSAVKKNGKAKIIFGNNVLNHIENLEEAMIAIKEGLRDDGYFICEVPSLKDTLEKYLFDMIFHEHISTFSVKSIDTLLKKYALFITKVESVNYHGGSLRIYASPNIKQYNPLVKKFITGEEKAKIFDILTYKKFMIKIIKDKNEVLAKIYALKKKGKKIAAIGAGARSNTLLNFYRLDNTIINFVTDASKHKIGKFTPGSSIQIKDDSSLKSEKIDIALITAWNIGKYLTQKIRKINDRIVFIVPGEKELM